MTSAGRAAVWLVVAGLLAAVALLAAQGALVPFPAAVVPASAVALVLRALVRQQRAPSLCDRPLVPERYRVADDLTQAITVVVEAAEAEAR
jgi:hypothetical protein